MINKIKKWLLSWLPDYAKASELGFKASTYNGDFILTKKFDWGKISLHQSIEPHHPQLSKFIDFEVEEACIVISFNDNSSGDKDFLEHFKALFDYVYIKDNYVFLFDRLMQFNSNSTSIKLEKVHNQLISK